MRHRTTLIGWPRRDPRRYRFPLPNTVWEYELKPIEFVLLSYLCYRHSRGGTDALTSEIIAAGIYKTVNTVKKHLTVLERKGLITDRWSPAPNVQCVDGKKFFTIPNEVFLLNLSPSAFMLYAYLLLIEDRRTHTCHPSYNTITAETGMTKNTAIKSIGALLEMGLVTMEHSSYFDQRGMKWKGNNLYTVLPTRAAVDAFHQRQLRRSEMDVEQRRAQTRLSRLCAPLKPLPASGPRHPQHREAPCRGRVARVRRPAISAAPEALGEFDGSKMKQDKGVAPCRRPAESHRPAVRAGNGETAGFQRDFRTF